MNKKYPQNREVDSELSIKEIVYYIERISEMKNEYKHCRCVCIL